ncbi:1930_t:CDS:2 [Acaulospora colombiana]|uniref:1930_t:CDS:1 n=1 Tax=Acaulospora colombiana TaxID=27376 RepID=A0ACA9JVG6_9GLOM|nr:1930_t:CDS:2 [Acaulospora colombiana]
MTEVSKLVSIYWRNEPEMVKETYKKIAHDVELELNERRRRNASFCRVAWKNPERKKERGTSIKKKRKLNDLDSGTITPDAISNQFDNIYEVFPSSREETNLSSNSETRKNSIDKTAAVGDSTEVIEYGAPNSN